MRFSLPQLEAFVWICRLGTFHAAAERLHLTQPTVSLRIRELEQALGARLFERRGNGMRLSAQGSILAQYAERSLALFDEMEVRLRSGDPMQGTLRLGASDTFAMTCLPGVVNALEAAYPQLRIELTVTHSTALGELLTHKKLDLALLTETRLNSSIAIEPIGRTDVAWISGPGRHLKRGPLRPGDLAGVTILTVPPPSPLHDVITEWFGTDGAPIPVFSTCNNLAVISQLVASGVAMSVLPVCLVQRKLASGELIRYRAYPEFAPRMLCAAYPGAVRGTGIDALLNITRQSMTQSGIFEAP